MTALWFVAFVAMGFIGLPYPSRSLTIAMAGGAVASSALWISLGSVGFVAWWRGYRDAESVAMRGLAALTVLHGVGVAIFAGKGGLQTGLLIVAAGFGFLAWAKVRHEFGLSRTAVALAVQKVGSDRRSREG